MPIPKHPLTPLSSTDIASQDPPLAHGGDAPLNLPPPAMQSPRVTKNAIADGDTGTASPESNRKRKRAGAARGTSAGEPPSPAFSLPPPPTRSRTIIQMQPGVGRSETSQGSGKSGHAAMTASNTTADKSKSDSSKKSASGKRAARKTAHSVIEKRRRSKMNEEFDTMKDMIPACKGQTMHKLAILQAGIEYLRYLEQCVTDLKTANKQSSTPLMRPGFGGRAGESADHSAAMSEDSGDGADESEEEDEDEDEEEEEEEEEEGQTAEASEDDDGEANMTDLPSTRYASASHSGRGTLSVSTTSLPVSPTILGALYSPHISAHDYNRAQHSRPQAADASVLHEVPKADFEATAALLMLNGSRSAKTGSGVGDKSGRGLSVQDLLIR